MTVARQVVGELLDARLVAYRRFRVRLCPPWFGRIFTPSAVNLEQFFRCLVPRLELVVFDGPFRRKSIGVLDASEILLPETEENAAVDLRIAADKVMEPGFEAVASRRNPRLIGLIPGLRKTSFVSQFSRSRGK